MEHANKLVFLGSVFAKEQMTPNEVNKNRD